MQDLSVLAQKYCLRTESPSGRGVLYTPSFKTCGVKAPQVWVLRGIQGRSAFTSLIHGGLFSYKLGGGGESTPPGAFYATICSSNTLSVLGTILGKGIQQ